MKAYYKLIKGQKKMKLSNYDKAMLNYLIFARLDSLNNEINRNKLNIHVKYKNRAEIKNLLGIKRRFLK